ncbi:MULTISPECIES: hypothetical protein [Bradyrhizobium]|uniref:hypothetical protein n=1 Tax=Bradyrhizobium TaxID=374 RepID=UPI0011AEAB51|nr:MULTISPECIES: hypothetical protein [Bradyrhizobium]
MSFSSWGQSLGKKQAEKARRPRFGGAAFSKTLADLIGSAMASDTAQPSIVAGATTVDGAAVGPVQLHGAGPYSRTAGGVKRELLS